MEGTYQLIIRLPYADVPQGFVDWLKDRVDGYLICQHDADEDVKTTHCHVSFSKMSVTQKMLDKAREKYKINGDVSRLLSKCVNSKMKYDEEKLNVYCIKGDIESVKAASYLPAALEAWAARWVPKADLPNPSRGAVHGDRQPAYDEWDVLKKDFQRYYSEMASPSVTLDSIRTWTMRWYWKRDGRMPPATCYKRNAASLYVYATELSLGSIECAFEELKELWY